MATASCSTIQCFIPELSTLDNYTTGRSPYLGGQDFLRGCLVAVNDSLTIIDGRPARTENFFFGPGTTVSEILDAAVNDSICSSTTGLAPEVLVPYEWCLRNLPGWQSATWSGIMGPLVQFILPCVAFCYNIPREWKLRVGRLREKPQLDPLGLAGRAENTPRRSHRHPPPLLPPPPAAAAAAATRPSSSSSFSSRLTGGIARATGACANGAVVLVAVTLELIVLGIDTFLWMAICFVMAGPMILSAAYEYRLDWNNLDMLADRGAGFPSVSRARLLLCTVAGNMKMRDEGEGGGGIGEEGEEMSSLLESQAQSAWVRVMRIAEEVRQLESHLDHHHDGHNQHHHRSSSFSSSSVQQGAAAAVSPVGLGLAPSPGRRSSSVVAVEAEGVGPRLKLQTLLDAQPGFGGYIGAPTVFFIGSFGYNIADSDTSPGLETVAITLAFGMFWMYIPHTAVISNTLLASNDPSTLQGLVGKKAEKNPHLRHTTATTSSSSSAAASSSGPPPRTRLGRLARSCRPRIHELVGAITRDAYESTYEPVALWRRGPNKQSWMLEAIRAIRDRDECPGDAVEAVEAALVFNRRDWAFAVSLTLVLLSIPYVLAFTTSYLTPLKGLSCRSLTHTVFFLSQCIQVAVWSLETHQRVSQELRRGRGIAVSVQVPVLPPQQQQQQQQQQQRGPPNRRRRRGRWVQMASAGGRWLVRAAAGVLARLPGLVKLLARLVSLFSAIGGTIMQVIGVYGNCTCLVDAWSWTNPGNPQAAVTLSHITKADILASENWNINGALASAALALVTAVGWWHRRELWKRFTEETMRLPDAAGVARPAGRPRRASSVPSTYSEALDGSLPLLDPSRSPG